MTYEACYRSEHLVVDAMEAYTAMTRELPVHLIFGTVHDVGCVAFIVRVASGVWSR
jgi:hypothetical protein